VKNVGTVLAAMGKVSAGIRAYGARLTRERNAGEASEIVSRRGSKHSENGHAKHHSEAKMEHVAVHKRC